MTNGSLHQLKVSKNAHLSTNNGKTVLIFEVKNGANLKGNHLLKVVNSKNNNNSLEFEVTNKENSKKNNIMSSSYKAPNSFLHHRSYKNLNNLRRENVISSMNELVKENNTISMNQKKSIEPLNLSIFEKSSKKSKSSENTFNNFENNDRLIPYNSFTSSMNPKELESEPLNFSYLERHESIKKLNNKNKQLNNKSAQLIDLSNYEDKEVKNNIKVKRIIRGKNSKKYGLGSTNKEINNILSSNNPINENENNLDHIKYGRSKSLLLNNMIKKKNKGLSYKYIRSNQYNSIKKKVNNTKKYIHKKNILN